MSIRRSLFALTAVIAVACAGTNIGSPGDYQKVALNRVFPYPSADELARQKTEVTLATHYTTELPKKVVGPSMSTVQHRLLDVLTQAGARVIDRSLDDLKAVRRDLSKPGQARDRKQPDVNWVLVSRITRYSHGTSYEPPSGLFKSDEELASDPGTCTHRGEVGVDIKAFTMPGDEKALSTFTLTNSGEFEQPDHDEKCPLDAARRQQLFDEVLEEALACVGTSVKNRFAPRGYVQEHRVSEAGDHHIYKTSLGSQNGARAGLELKVFRVQYMTTAEGDQAREEHRIGEALITEQIGKDYSWVTVDEGSLVQPILAGDLVRALYTDDLMDGLGLGRCANILTIEVDEH